MFLWVTRCKTIFLKTLLNMHFSHCGANFPKLHFFVALIAQYGMAGRVFPPHLNLLSSRRHPNFQCHENHCNNPTSLKLGHCSGAQKPVLHQMTSPCLPPPCAVGSWWHLSLWDDQIFKWLIMHLYLDLENYDVKKTWLTISTSL